MMSLITMVLPAALKLGMAWFQFYVTKSITEDEYKKAAVSFAIARGKGNKSADARISIENQFQQLEKEIKNESEN